MTIREMITATGLSQRAFAEMLGIPKRTVENWCAETQSSRRSCPGYVLALIEYKLRNERMLIDIPADGEYPTAKSKVIMID